MERQLLVPLGMIIKFTAVRLVLVSFGISARACLSLAPMVALVVICKASCPGRVEPRRQNLER